jgi:hypothetical protein
MAKPSKPERFPTPGDSDVNLLAWIATCVSIFAFLFYYRHAEVMLYGDAIAHINIARRVFDSRTPGLLQLGTVWLPLPHLLMIPFLISTEMWRRGVGGSIPSMAAYVFAVIGIFRLTRSSLSRTGEPDGFARVGAWAAAIIFAANPNLIYIQSTAMGETVYLAFFLWSVAYFTESLRGKTSSLTKSALCLGAACLTRYDGWFLAVILSAIVILRSFLTGESHSRVPSRSQVIKFVLIAAMAPALWIFYNAAVYRNPLEFANGPYSARAIEQRTQSVGHPGHPGSGNPFLAGLYFVKSVEDNVAQNQWVQRIWILLMLAATVGALLVGPWRKTFAPLLLLLIPLPFYALSIAYGGVPLFIPNWWPYTHYNVRYGLQLLPLLSVALAMLVYLALRADARKRYMRLFAMLGIFLLVIVSYASIWQANPIVLGEAQTNMRTRNQLQLEVARWLEKLPPDSTLLMYLGDHVGALERAGVPLKRTINEGNHRVWKQPADSEGFWERALANPSQYVDYVLAFDGDPVWQAVHNMHLRELIELHVTGQPRAILYRAR